MTALVVAVVAAGLAGRVVAAVLLPAPAPARIDALRRPGRRAPPPGRRPVAGPRRTRILAALVVVGVLVEPVLTVAGVGAVVLARRWRRLRTRRAIGPAGSVEADLPDLVDLLRLTVGAGLTVPTALPLLARWGPPSMGGALAGAVRTLDAGTPTLEVLAAVGDAWGEPAQPLVRALSDHVRHGTSLGPTLDRLGSDARGRRRRAAETRARQLPVLLLFPLVLCTLPAFGLLTVAPIVAGTLRSLDGERLEASASPELPTEEPPCTAFSSTPTSPPPSSSWH